MQKSKPSHQFCYSSLSNLIAVETPEKACFKRDLRETPNWLATSEGASPAQPSNSFCYPSLFKKVLSKVP